MKTLASSSPRPPSGRALAHERARHLRGASREEALASCSRWAGAPDGLEGRRGLIALTVPAADFGAAVAAREKTLGSSLKEPRAGAGQGARAVLAGLLMQPESDLGRN